MTTLPERLQGLATLLRADGDEWGAYDLLNEAAQALQAAPEGVWRTIDGAPKDGTVILIPYVGRAVPAWYCADEPMWKWKFLWCAGSSGGETNAYEESAVKWWAPMPSPTFADSPLAAPSPSAALRAGEILIDQNHKESKA